MRPASPNQSMTVATPPSHTTIADRFQSFWNNLGPGNVATVRQLYAPDIVFEDPAHRLEGLQALQAYLERLYANVISCTFDFHEVIATDEHTILTWTMKLRHPRLQHGQPVHVHGVSHLRHNGQLILFHRDYFDLGEMLYERIPLVGAVVRTIRRRL